MVNLSPGRDPVQTRYLRVYRMNGQMTPRDHLPLGKLLVDPFCSWSECHRGCQGPRLSVPPVYILAVILGKRVPLSEILCIGDDANLYPAYL